MSNQTATVREFIYDIGYILAPINLAAEKLSENLYTYGGDKTVAAAYFEELKQRLEAGRSLAEEFLKNGGIYFSEQGVDKKDGVFGQAVSDKASGHIMGLHLFLDYCDGFLEETRKVAADALIDPAQVEKCMQQLSSVVLAVNTYAKTTGNTKKDQLKKNTMLRKIADAASDIRSMITTIRNCDELLEESRRHLDLLDIMDCHLAEISNLRAR